MGALPFSSVTFTDVSGGEQVLKQFHPAWSGLLWRIWFRRLVFVCDLITLGAIGLALIGQLSALPVIACIVVPQLLWIILAKLLVKTTTYTITSRRVKATYGLFSQEDDVAAIEHVVDTSVQRSVGERLLGIGRINFDTAGERQKGMLVWWGVPKPREIVDLIEHVQSGGYQRDIDETEHDDGE